MSHDGNCSAETPTCHGNRCHDSLDTPREGEYLRCGGESGWVSALFAARGKSAEYGKGLALAAGRRKRRTYFVAWGIRSGTTIFAGGRRGSLSRTQGRYASLPVPVLEEGNESATSGRKEKVPLKSQECTLPCAFQRCESSLKLMYRWVAKVLCEGFSGSQAAVEYCWSY